MRIVAGRFRGRRLQAPEGRDLRPTAERVREAVFNILAHGFEVDLEGLAVLDVFAGTGALGLEALSRGASFVTFIDNGTAANDCLRRNLKTLEAAREGLVLRLDATALPPPPRAARAPAGLVFLDPPYGQDFGPPALAGLAGQGWIAPGALAVMELASRETFAPPPGFEVLDERTYGAARVIFLRCGETG